MSGICGWSNNQLSLDEGFTTLQNMASILKLNLNHSTEMTHNLFSGLATVGLPNHSILDHKEGVSIAIQGSIRWMDSELEKESSEKGLTTTIIKSYQKNGVDFLRNLSGGFSLCLIDECNRKTLIAIDKMGVSSLFFTCINSQLIFASSARAILKHPHTYSLLNPQAIFDYFYFHMVPSPRSIFDGIEKLLPGQYILFENNKTTKGFYWQLSYDENVHTSLSELEDEFLDKLESSVQLAAVDGNPGTFLSGGTDSSTIAGILRKLKSYPVDTYSVGFKTEGFDETYYARLAAKHFDTTGHEYFLTPQDVVDTIPLIANAYDEPFGNASAVPTYFCAKMAKNDGRSMLLAGDGGDELFGGNERYAKQKVFEFYQQIPETIRHHVIEASLFNFPHADKIWPLAKAKSYITQANIPLPDRLESYNFLNRIALRDIFENDFLDQLNTLEPIELLRETFNRSNAKSKLNQNLFMDLQFTLADNDLRKVNRMCELAQLDVRYPLLDERLVLFSAKLLPSLKIQRLQLRYFFKYALRNVLPAEILTKNKHGFGLPFGLWMNSYKPLSDLAYENIAALSRRGIVKPEYIVSIQNLYKQYPGYYGVFIWVMIMLEQWLMTIE